MSECPACQDGWSNTEDHSCSIGDNGGHGGLDIDRLNKIRLAAARRLRSPMYLTRSEAREVLWLIGEIDRMRIPMARGFFGTVTVQRPSVTCPWCGKQYTQRRKDQQTCGQSRCRQRQVRTARQAKVVI